MREVIDLIPLWGWIALSCSVAAGLVCALVAIFSGKAHVSMKDTPSRPNIPNIPRSTPMPPVTPRLEQKPRVWTTGDPASYQRMMSEQERLNNLRKHGFSDQDIGFLAARQRLEVLMKTPGLSAEPRVSVTPNLSHAPLASMSTVGLSLEWREIEFQTWLMRHNKLYAPPGSETVTWLRSAFYAGVIAGGEIERKERYLFQNKGSSL